VAHSLDVVAHGVLDERPIVRGMILRPETRGAKILTAGREGSLVELINDGAIWETLM